MAGENGKGRAGPGIPQPRGVVVGGCQYQRIVGREGGESNCVAVPGKNGELSACCGVPQPGGVVARRGNDAGAVRRKRRVPDAVGVSFQGAFQRARRDVPIRAVWSSSAVTARLPSGENATDHTVP